jgi:formaldehyde-activating enzyme involved in methanogenesis
MKKMIKNEIYLEKQKKINKIVINDKDNLIEKKSDKKFNFIINDNINNEIYLNLNKNYKKFKIIYNYNEGSSNNAIKRNAKFLDFL